jgi:hypothetical protein
MKILLGRIGLAAGLAALLISGCATSQDQKALSERDAFCVFVDENHDGKITKEEFTARATDKQKAAAAFDRCDTGKKGYLTYDEVYSQPALLPPEISMMDSPAIRRSR